MRQTSRTGWDEQSIRRYRKLKRRSRTALLLMSHYNLQIKKLCRPRLGVVEGFESVNINFDSFTETFYNEHIGFTASECEEIFDNLHFPVRLKIEEHTAHEWSISGVHCFLYYLYRIHTTNERQSMDQITFGYDYSSLSKIYNGVAEWLDLNHCHRLNIIPVHRFQEFNRVIKEHIVHSGLIIPPEADCVCLFLDGCRFRSARPAPMVSCCSFFWIHSPYFVVVV
jgi:hypothetical protein